MVSAALTTKISPLARSCLLAISAAIVIDAIMTMFAVSAYPYLTDYYIDVLYINTSRSMTVVYLGISLAAILVAISTAFATYKSSTNYVVIHICITGVFLPVSILVFFTSMSARYKGSDYEADVKHMIKNYRINYDHQAQDELKLKLPTFINLIDLFQTKFKCCGIDSASDWIGSWDHYVAPSCCKHKSVMVNEKWAALFGIKDAKHEFEYCDESEVYATGCLSALKEDEHSKYNWISDLIVFLIVITLANTIVSLILFGLSKTEDMPNETQENEFAIMGLSAKPRPSQPTITGIRPRKSVVQTLGPIPEQIATISPAVRFNLANPRPSISSINSTSKFSPAARRGSSFL